MLGEEGETVVVPGVDLPAATQPVVAVPAEPWVDRARMQAGQRVRELLPEVLAARSLPQHRQHEQFPIHQDDVGRRHAAALMQGSQPFSLSGEDVIVRRLGERFDKHRRRIPPGRNARQRREPTAHRLHRDDIVHPGPTQAFEQKRRLHREGLLSARRAVRRS
jgi:hypothetical protein